VDSIRCGLLLHIAWSISVSVCLSVCWPKEPSCYLMGPGSPLEEALLGANADTAHMRRNLKPDSVPSIFSWILGGPTGKE